MLRLRRKLEINPIAPPTIKTARGIGCVFGLPVEPPLEMLECLAHCACNIIPLGCNNLEARIDQPVPRPS
jgi:hypothetical protein